MKHMVEVETADRRGPKVTIVCAANWHKAPFKVAVYNKSMPGEAHRSVGLWLTDAKTGSQQMYEPGGVMPTDSNGEEAPGNHITETLTCSRCAASGPTMRVMARREHLQRVFDGLEKLGENRVTLDRLQELVERVAS